MKTPRLSTLLLTLAVAICLGSILKLAGDLSRSSAQDVGQSLDIARYADEPFGFVDVKVGDRSLKDKISVNFRGGDQDRQGLDKVDFKGKDDWCKLLRVKLSNTSGRPIIGLQAFLYIKPSGSELRFGTEMLPAPHQTLEPGAELELAVDEESWARTEARMKEHGADGRSASVILSIENVTFNEDLMWDRGQIHQRDPKNRGKWRTIEKKLFLD